MCGAKKFWCWYSLCIITIITSQIAGEKNNCRWYACPGHTSALHYVEAALACAACASAVRHALRLVAGTAPVPAALSPAQRCLLGLAPASAPPTPIPDLSYRNHVEDERAESLSPPRSWKAEGSPRAPPSPPPPALQHERALRDRFIADQAELDSYLRWVPPS